MSNRKYIFYSAIFLLFFSTNCSSQEKKQKNMLVNRKMVAAGRFYESNPAALENGLKELFSKALPKKVDDNVLAIISPHAGYAFSGEVAATSFNQINPTKEYDNIFILASSHNVSFDGASIYNKGNYITPLGEVKVNIKLADKLIKENNIFTYYSGAHDNEHSLEVQLPFLQYIMKTNYRIVPIVLGVQSVQPCKKIAEALKPFFNEKNLFIISTDFSHYPAYEDANLVDKLTAQAIESNSVDNLKKAIDNNSRKNIRSLSTSLCGWSSVFTLLYITQDNPNIDIMALQYKNSGDYSYGDKFSVVGYYSLVVSEKENPASETTGFHLSKSEKITLLEIARNTIEKYINKNKVPEINESELSKDLLTNCGAFVTLHKNHSLRGCIGRFTADEPLYKVVQQMAIASATQDYRFPKVKPSEINKIDIEISVLTPLKKINSIDEIEMGKHGIYIKRGGASGTFLPQVAKETGWTKEEFLGHCSKDKAGLGWNGWKDAEIYIYEAYVFSESDIE